MTDPQNQAPQSPESSDTGQSHSHADPKLLELVVCPVTKETLSYDASAQELISHKAGLAYPIKDGIPILLVDEARELNP